MKPFSGGALSNITRVTSARNGAFPVGPEREKP